jgi:hypothetical protein
MGMKMKAVELVIAIQVVIMMGIREATQAYITKVIEELNRSINH